MKQSISNEKWHDLTSWCRNCCNHHESGDNPASLVGQPRFLVACSRALIIALKHFNDRSNGNKRQRRSREAYGIDSMRRVHAKILVKENIDECHHVSA